MVYRLFVRPRKNKSLPPWGEGAPVRTLGQMRGSACKAENPKQKGEKLLNYTENYQLPQWVESDRVLMEVFNDAMEKVDQGLGALETQSPYVLLKDYTVTEEYVSGMSLDISDIDWNQWQTVCADIWTFNSQGGTANVKINGGGRHVSMSGSRDEPFAEGTISPVESETYNARPIRIYFFPMKDKRNLVRAISMNDSTMFFSYLETPFSDAATLGVSTSGSAFRTGSRIAVWGLR